MATDRQVIIITLWYGAAFLFLVAMELLRGSAWKDYLIIRDMNPGDDWEPFERRRARKFVAWWFCVGAFCGSMAWAVISIVQLGLLVK